MRPPPRPRPTPRTEPPSRPTSRPQTAPTPRAAGKAASGKAAAGTAADVATAERPRTGATPRAEKAPRGTSRAVVPAPPHENDAREHLGREYPGRESPGRVSTAMADRLAERTAMRRHRAWQRVVAWVLALAVLVGLVVAAFWSPVLALDGDEVVVTGAGSTVDPDAVRDVVAAVDGTPLPRLDTVALRQQILGLHGVKDVSLNRSWPHGLRVSLTARVPVAAVPDGGGYAVLDSEGVRLGSGSSVPSGLPEVAVPLDDALALQAALHVLAALPPRLEAKVEQVSAETQDAVETVLDDGTTVRWGSSADMPLKVEVVRTLRKLDGSSTTIDVSSPELPVTG
ncbi:hypothetical protein GCM10009809_30540 [Isoptericola hypogeus]|uniref:Cell division protein FtsQ n=1 Tax=Isoptericola hypogeus TaxID=300179 RepID=A0ABP4VNL9_9MICO